MQNLSATLHNADAALLPLLATLWQVDIDALSPADAVRELTAAMLDPDRLEAAWAQLGDAERGALQTLAKSAGHQMPASMFTRLYGEIRRMGRAGIEREEPHLRPKGPAEALFYRGLIAEAFENSGAGARAVVFIPSDLAVELPLHLTSYDELDDEDEDFPDDEDDEDEGEREYEAVAPSAAAPTAAGDRLPALEAGANPRQADTSVVDDLTTLLAELQLTGPELSGGLLEDEDLEALLPYLLVADHARLRFLLMLGIEGDLVVVQDGRAYPNRVEVRKWLAAPRSQQIKWLADTWRGSSHYRDLWHVPGLHPDDEQSGWPYDPRVGRAALLRFIAQSVPLQAWWSVDDFIEWVRETDPDFQRPGGDYDSWYIRSDAGEYLSGFESWDAVEGALLEFYLTGPLHWLGLLDVADDAVRLTAYGRAFVSGDDWPAPPEQEEKITVRPDGTLLASRRVPRVDRFQLARFTTWDEPGDPYRYKLDSRGIQRAAAQGINTEQIAAFLRRQLGDTPLPAQIVHLLEKWQGGSTTAVTFEPLLVLRTTSPETLDHIYEEPALRRYLGSRLGPMAAVVRSDQQEELREALGQQGISVELLGE